MRKILVFSTNYLPFVGGAEIAVKEISSQLADIQFDLIAPRYMRSLAKEEKIGNVNVYRVGFGFGLDKFFMPFYGFVKAVRLYKKNKYDLNWSIMASQASIASAFFKIFQASVPLVLTLQEGDEEENLFRYVFGSRLLYRIFIRPWHLMVFKKADYVSAISSHLKDRAIANGVAVPIEVVPNGVDVPAFSKEFPEKEIRDLRHSLGFGKEDVVIISVSRLVKKNGLSDLIDAISLLPKEYKLLLIGDGPLSMTLRSHAGQLGISERVVFCGQVSPAEIPKYYRASDIFARPSLSEGFGNAFVESMAAGCPVIGTPVGGIVDFLEDKKNGVYCGTGDPKDLALKIGMVWRDVDLRNFLITEGKKTASRYSWARIAIQMKEKIFLPAAQGAGMSYVITTGIYPPQIGGPAQYAKNLRESLQQEGHNVRVLTYGVEKRMPTGIRHFIFFLRAAAAFFNADFIISLDTMSVGFPSVLAARLLRRKIAVRIGGDFLWEQFIERTGEKISIPDFYMNKRNDHLGFKERNILKIIGWTLRKSSVAVFSTHWQRDIFVGPYGLDKEKTVIIENYYGKKEVSYDFTRKNFIWAARPIKLKNLNTLREAFAKAKKISDDIELDELSCPYEELMDKISSCYAVVLPSLSEVSPNFILDAVRHNKPFIATKYCGLVDRLKGLGIFVDPNNAEEISKKILELSDPNNYKAYKTRLENYSYTHSWYDISSEFQKAIEKK